MAMQPVATVKVVKLPTKKVLIEKPAKTVVVVRKVVVPPVVVAIPGIQGPRGPAGGDVDAIPPSYIDNLF